MSTPALVAGDAIGTVEERAPFFLVGSERSGTTLLRLMLSHHPRIACAPEFEFLVERLPDDPEAGWPALPAYREWLSTNRIFRPHALEVDPALSYPELARGFLAQFCERTGKPIWGATCHTHFDRLLRLWPDARFVHLVRDGRDVARSCIGMGWVGNVWYGAGRWVAAEETWARLAAAVPTERRIDVRYEELVRDPEGVLGRICAFLGTGYDPAMLSYPEGSTYGRPDPALLQQWKRKLSARELALLEARIGPLLRERGYDESGVPPASVGPLGRFSLAVDNRLRFWGSRRRKYGLALLVRRRLAETLGLEGARRRAVLEMNAVDDRGIR